MLVLFGHGFLVTAVTASPFMSIFFIRDFADSLDRHIYVHFSRVRSLVSNSFVLVPGSAIPSTILFLSRVLYAVTE